MARRPKAIAILKSHVAKLRGLSKLPQTLALRDAVEKVIGDQIAAGTEPDGTPWILTKKGEQPLKRAARAVVVEQSRNVITATIGGHHVRHHLGAVKGKIRRRILPSKRLPSPYADAIREALAAEFRRIMGSSS